MITKDSQGEIMASINDVHLKDVCFCVSV